MAPAGHFGLEGSSQKITLLSDGSHGSITPQSALSELSLTGTTRTPTATSQGQALQLLSLVREGNPITTTFSGGVIAVFGLQTSGSAPTPTPIRPVVEIQRLAGDHRQP